MRIDSDSDDNSSDDDDDDGETFIDPDYKVMSEKKLNGRLKKKVKRRAKRREKRKLKLAGGDIEQEIVAVKKKLDVKGKTGKELEEMQLLNSLGFGGCLACRCNPCKWEPCVDVPRVMERKKLLDQRAKGYVLIRTVILLRVIFV